MSLTIQEREFVEAAETKLNDAERAVITVAFAEIYAAAKARGVPLAHDDKAARLEAAIVKFIIESRIK